MEGWALPGHKGQVTDGVGASFLVVNTTETVIMSDRPLYWLSFWKTCLGFYLL